MEVYLIRHTTPVLEPGLIYGRKELLLHDTFPDELATVLQQLPEHFDAVYSSPAFRCVELAKEISPDFKMDVRLQELDFGEWEGKTWDTVDQVALQCWMDDYVNVCVPGGESMMQMHERITEFWDELSRETYTRIAIVTHAGVMRLLLASVRSIALTNIFDIKINYGEVIIVSHLLPDPRFVN
ncbi:histidine phosphatase family protein [Paucibacter sp. O1-1]|nr:histidine phosphatase family protein [Paucibacter sp. O1-1]MDA3825999.1 histidine phosphatase family protein [Paucibacter sp. O1-1]